MCIRDRPIIIAPLTVDKFYQWLVIDGNHRITHAIAEREKSVKAFSLDPNALVEGNLFSTGFDKFLYIFQNEMIALASYIHRDGYSDEEAIKLAYFLSLIHILFGLNNFSIRIVQVISSLLLLVF